MEPSCHLNLEVEETFRILLEKTKLMYITKHMFVAGKGEILFDSGDGMWGG